MHNQETEPLQHRKHISGGAEVGIQSERQRTVSHALSCQAED